MHFQNKDPSGYKKNECYLAQKYFIWKLPLKIILGKVYYYKLENEVKLVQITWKT